LAVHLGAFLFLCLVPTITAAQGMLSTKHNLSVTGPGPIKAETESQVCVFCHTPHNADPDQPPLWNRAFSSATYTPYDSPSIQFTPGQPTGYSKLCLSCHDGTIAIGQVRNLWGQSATIQMAGVTAEGKMPAGPTLIGTNLTNDHPISFVFDASLAAADGELVDPSTLTGTIKLYPGTTTNRDNIQCTTCHDPHTVVNTKFLKKSAMGQADNLCLTCHQKPGWIGSTHESDVFFWPANQIVTRVRDWSCFGCHTPHTIQGAERLLRDAAIAGQSAIEETCYRCHQPAASGGIVFDIKTEFQKTWPHPIALNPGAHRPVFLSSTPLPENVLLSPGQPAPDPRFTDEKHVECVDCHNPHKVKKTNRTEGMPGILLDGTIINNVINDPNPADGQPSQVQYPICLRCHGDTYSTVIGTGTLPSGATPSNKRTEFQTANSAFHPIGGPGRNTSSNLNDQLTPNGLSTSAVIKCTDCHNSNAYENTSGRVASTGAGATTPVGPHGSIYPSIRRARYENTLPGPASWNPANFNLCFRCHDVTRLTARRTGDGARTNFYDDINGKDNLHWLHLDDKIGGSRPLCKSCHYNIHSNQEQTNTQYNINGVVTCAVSPGAPCAPPSATPTRLINFHPNIRGISGRPRPEWWLNTGTKQRQCFLQCHNPDGSPGGVVMGGAAKEAGGKKAEYRPNSGDLP
jgi:predicted CXXCH cytochrome family protein